MNVTAFWIHPPVNTSPDIWEGTIQTRIYQVGFLATKTRIGWQFYLYDLDTEETLAYNDDCRSFPSGQMWAIRTAQNFSKMAGRWFKTDG